MRTIGTADLPFVTRTAKVSARFDEALTNPDTTPTALSQYASLYIRMTNSLGLNPAARRAVSPLSAPKSAASPDDEFT